MPHAICKTAVERFDQSLEEGRAISKLRKLQLYADSMCILSVGSMKKRLYACNIEI